MIWAFSIPTPTAFLPFSALDLSYKGLLLHFSSNIGVSLLFDTNKGDELLIDGIRDPLGAKDVKRSIYVVRYIHMLPCTYTLKRYELGMIRIELQSPRKQWLLQSSVATKLIIAHFLPLYYFQIRQRHELVESIDMLQQLQYMHV
jgi:hypothetical protein